MKKGTRNIIWSNVYGEADLDPNSPNWKEFLDEEYPDTSQEQREQIVAEENDSYLEDERGNLDIQLSNDIIIIADLGLWNGRHTGYKLIKSGNIKDCLFFTQNIEQAVWYVDGYHNLRCDAYHHDGINHYLYRMLKENISDNQKDTFLNKIYDGVVTMTDITRYTVSVGKEIEKVYGWEKSA